MSDEQPKQAGWRLSRGKKQDLAMSQVVSASRSRKLPRWGQFKQLPSVLSRAERIIALAAVAAIALSGLFVAGWYVLVHRVQVPASGGEYVEALIGEPRRINPLYASGSDADADLAALVYAGLVRWNPNEGLVNDMAESLEVSEDGKTYTARLREDARFHDGEPVLARDVLFTVTAIQNPLYGSPLLGNFEGVTVSQVDDRTVSFALSEPRASFPATLTVGILPADLWFGIQPQNAQLADLNLRPVGSGPYRFKEFAKDKTGSIRFYALERFKDHSGDDALIERLTFKFYPDAESALSALENKNVEGLSFVPTELDERAQAVRGTRILRPSVLRLTGLYLNQPKNGALSDARVRKAIEHAIDKQAVLDAALGGTGTIINAPILEGLPGYYPDIQTRAHDLGEAERLLDEAGYKLDPAPADESEEDSEGEVDSEETGSRFSIVITTVNTPEFVRAAEAVAASLREAGIDASVRPVEQESFFSAVIEPRDYEILLTGTLIGDDGDPSPFWHSSQSGSGGFNLAGYGNRNADTLLEEALAATDPAVREEKLRAFQDLLFEDAPAVFLYQSRYAYVLPDKVKNAELGSIGIPSDRFGAIEDWYIKTKNSLR